MNRFKPVPVTTASGRSVPVILPGEDWTKPHIIGYPLDDLAEMLRIHVKRARQLKAGDCESVPPDLREPEDLKDLAEIHKERAAEIRASLATCRKIRPVAN